MDPKVNPQMMMQALNAPPPSQAAMDALGQGAAQPTANDTAQLPASPRTRRPHSRPAAGR